MLGIRDGGQDTPAGCRGILTPTQLFVFKSSINTTMISNFCILSCYNCDKINSIGLNEIFFHIIGFESGVGSRYPSRGILTPTQLFVFKSSINTTMISNFCILSCYNCDKINSIGLNENFFHIFGLESGVGVKIPQPGYLDPHSVICF